MATVCIGSIVRARACMRGKGVELGERKCVRWDVGEGCDVCMGDV